MQGGRVRETARSTATWLHHVYIVSPQVRVTSQTSDFLFIIPWLGPKTGFHRIHTLAGSCKWHENMNFKMKTRNLLISLNFLESKQHENIRNLINPAPLMQPRPFIAVPLGPERSIE